MYIFTFRCYILKFILLAYRQNFAKVTSKRNVTLPNLKQLVLIKPHPS